MKLVFLQWYVNSEILWQFQDLTTLQNHCVLGVWQEKLVETICAAIVIGHYVVMFVQNLQTTLKNVNWWNLGAQK